MKAKSIKGKSITDLKSAVAESITADFKPTLAVVFSSISQDLKGICDVVDAEGIAIFGCTTSGEFIDEETETGSSHGGHVQPWRAGQGHRWKSGIAQPDDLLYSIKRKITS